MRYNPPNRLYGVPEGYKSNPSVPKFKKYLLVQSTPIIAPDAVTWSNKIPDGAWGMDGNDQYGDCVLAAAAHGENIWTTWSETGPEIVMTTAQTLQAYSEVTGFNPAIPSTDQGTMPDAMLKYWQTTGMPTNSGRRKILAYAAVDHTDLNEVKLAIDWFGFVLTSWALPLAFQNQQDWVLPPNQSGNNAPYSWGGHETLIGEYDGDNFKTVTWGAQDTGVDPALITNTDYCTSMYVAISEDWMRKDMKTPCLMDINALTWASQQIGK